ncbi:hypothetical protein ACVGWW_00305, partial [Enterobacter hormaechei]
FWGGFSLFVVNIAMYFGCIVVFLGGFLFLFDFFTIINIYLFYKFKFFSEQKPRAVFLCITWLS